MIIIWGDMMNTKRLMKRLASGLIGVSLSFGNAHTCAYAATDIQKYDAKEEYNRLKSHLDDVKLLYIKIVHITLTNYL